MFVLTNCACELSTEGTKVLLATPEAGVSTETTEWAMQGSAQYE